MIEGLKLTELNKPEKQPGVAARKLFKSIEFDISDCEGIKTSCLTGQKGFDIYFAYPCSSFE